MTTIWYTPLPEYLTRDSPSFTDADLLRTFVEAEVLKIIRDKVRDDPEFQSKVQEMSMYVLEMTDPDLPLDTLYQNIIRLDDRFSELSPVVARVMRDYEDKVERKALDEVSNLIRDGKFGDAQSLVQKVLARKLE